MLNNFILDTVLYTTNTGLKKLHFFMLLSFYPEQYFFIPDLQLGYKLWRNINTYYVDQLEINTFDELYKSCGNSKFDIIIDKDQHLSYDGYEIKIDENG